MYEMPTDDEKREAARKLRQLNSYESFEEFIHWCRKNGPTRIADLIEPKDACIILYDEIAGEYECSRCRKPVSGTDPLDDYQVPKSTLRKFSYCPRCGAKIEGGECWW